jgi:hypothetical protein
MNSSDDLLDIFDQIFAVQSDPLSNLPPFEEGGEHVLVGHRLQKFSGAYNRTYLDNRMIPY